MVLPREARNLIRPIRHQILDRSVVLPIHPRQLLESVKQSVRSSHEHRLTELRSHRQTSAMLKEILPQIPLPLRFSIFGR